MLPGMAVRPRIAIVGPGRLGTALALELAQAGYPISEVIARDNKASLRKAVLLARRVHSRAVSAKAAALDGKVVWFCVPDRHIANAARELARRSRWGGKVALHASGALSSDELGPLRENGAAVASVHPLMTFVGASPPTLRDVPFGMEGDAAALRLARRIVRDLGGEVFRVKKQAKAAYHAWGTFASPLLLATLVTAEQAARAAGLSTASARRKMLPIIRQTLENYSRLGPAAAFSGPIVRGEAAVVRKHLEALKRNPEIGEAYRALARVALRHLPARNRAELERVIGCGAREPRRRAAA